MLEIGSIVHGEVTSMTSFGAFISLPDGSSGMVHISEISPSYVNDIKDFLSEGQEVKVKIIEDNEKGKISLSIKRALDESDRRRPSGNKRPGGKSRRMSSNIWQGQQKSNEPMSFEDMMAKFKQESDEKIIDLRRSGESKHGGGYSRRGNKNN